MFCLFRSPWAKNFLDFLFDITELCLNHGISRIPNECINQNRWSLRETQIVQGIVNLKVSCKVIKKQTADFTFFLVY